MGVVFGIIAGVVALFVVVFCVIKYMKTTKSRNHNRKFYRLSLTVTAYLRLSYPMILSIEKSYFFENLTVMFLLLHSYMYIIWTNPVLKKVDHACVTNYREQSFLPSKMQKLSDNLHNLKKKIGGLFFNVPLSHTSDCFN